MLQRFFFFFFFFLPDEEKNFNYEEGGLYVSQCSLTYFKLLLKHSVMHIFFFAQLKENCIAFHG